VTCLLEVEKFRKNNKLAEGSFFVYRFSFIGKGTPEGELPRRDPLSKNKKLLSAFLPLSCSQQKQEEVVGTFVTPSM